MSRITANELENRTNSRFGFQFVPYGGSYLLLSGCYSGFSTRSLGAASLRMRPDPLGSRRMDGGSKPSSWKGSRPTVSDTWRQDPIEGGIVFAKAKRSTRGGVEFGTSCCFVKTGSPNSIVNRSTNQPNSLFFSGSYYSWRPSLFIIRTK